MGYGYRVGEVDLPIPEEIKRGVVISPPTPWQPAYRPAVQISLGCHVQGIALPHPDPCCPRTLIAGVRKRFARRPPDPQKRRPPNGDRLNLADFRAFVQDFVRENFQPLDPLSDTSVEAWLKKCPYPEWRKEELLNTWDRCNGKMTERFYRVKSFMKDETYLEYKHARGINSRTDEFKCFVGPIFRLIEEQVYKLDYFIKKVPVADRPRYITELLDRARALIVESDYTGYETHFTREVFEACEFVLYDYMTSALPQHQSFMSTMRRVLAGRNHCVFKHFFVDIDATRMSGEMNTSLGNGFTNLMLILYVSKVVGFMDVKCVVEGDDCLATGFGRPPSGQDFEKLGFTIKLKVHEEISESSFCGMIFDPRDMINVTDPKEVLASFGWAMSAYTRSTRARRMALLRCKALSYAHQYPGCPIISSLARYGLRVTSGYNVTSFIENERSLSLWEREQYRTANQELGGRFWRIPCRVPGEATRALVERKFGIDSFKQKEIEAYLDSLNSLQPLTIDFVDFPSVWHDYFSRYVHPQPLVDHLDGPGWHWPQPYAVGPLST